MPRLYAEADIFLNASVVDNQPVSILEAFASGLPVVSTPTGDIEAMVRYGEAGLIVPPLEPAAMAAAVLDLLEHPERARDMARRAHADTARYTWPAVRAEWAAVYAGAATDASAEQVPLTARRRIMAVPSNPLTAPAARRGRQRRGSRVRRRRSASPVDVADRDRVPQPAGSLESVRAAGAGRTRGRLGRVAREQAPSLAPPGAALRALREAAPGRFFAGRRSPARRGRSQTQFPGARREILAAADAALEGRFDLLGYRGLSFGDPIDWHLDPVWSRRTPLVALEPRRPARPGDRRRQQGRVGAEPASVADPARASVALTGDQRMRPRVSRPSTAGGTPTLRAWA